MCSMSPAAVSRPCQNTRDVQGLPSHEVVSSWRACSCGTVACAAALAQDGVKHGLAGRDYQDDWRRLASYKHLIPLIQALLEKLSFCLAVLFYFFDNQNRRAANLAPDVKIMSITITGELTVAVNSP